MASHAPLQSPSEQAITPWLQHLSQLMPPTGVLLVGAGAGTGPWVQLLQTLAVPSATLVEADDTQFEHLQRNVPQRDGWRLRKQVVGPQTETVTYHQASNAFESGLLEPESLRSLWPNLKTTRKQTRQATALAELQQDAETPANWLLVDCLPALPILQGAAQQLAAFDVIALRVLLNSTNAHSNSNSGNENTGNGAATSTNSNEFTQSASADALHPALQALGFRCLAIETSRHPAIGHALFVRDTAALVQTLAQTRAAAEQLAEERQKQVEQLRQAKEFAEKSLADALIAAKDAAENVKTEALAALHAEQQARAQEKTELHKALQGRAAAEQLAAERQKQVEKLRQAKEGVEKSLADALIAAKDAAENAKTEALAALHAEQQARVQEKTALHKALQGRAAAEQLAAERQKQVEQLQQAKEVAEKSLADALIAAKDAAENAKTEALAALHAEQQARAQEKTELLKALQGKLAHEHAWLAHSCIISDDLHQSVQKIIVSYKLAPKDLFDFLVELSDQISHSGDKVTALSYLNQARQAIAAPSREALTIFVKRLIKLGRPTEAEAVFTQAVLDGTGILPLSESEKSAIRKASQSIHQIVDQRSEHGHDLLLSAFNKHLPLITPPMNGRKPVLIEIGTTREDVPGQGSTRKLADYCKNHSIEFITVDMDPHNANMAQRMFSEMNIADFQAIAMKGEDYLRDYAGSMDFVFLDAYDFDHGKHSELRQSRYEKFLGSRIDEAECHRMHMDCAQSVAKKLSPFGLVCVDDTWLEDGRWTAKGTLAVPYLLANGFELVEARNRAALLRRKTETHGEQPA